MYKLEELNCFENALWSGINPNQAVDAKLEYNYHQGQPIYLQNQNKSTKLIPLTNSDWVVREP